MKYNATRSSFADRKTRQVPTKVKAKKCVYNEFHKAKKKSNEVESGKVNKNILVYCPYPVIYFLLVNTRQLERCSREKCGTKHCQLDFYSMRRSDFALSFAFLCCCPLLEVQSFSGSALPLLLKKKQNAFEKHHRFSSSSVFATKRVEVKVVRESRSHLYASPNEDSTGDSEKNPSWILTLTVVPLWLIYVSNQWSRSSIYYLVDFSSTDPQTAMNFDIGFDQGQYGVLASIAFTLLFALTSLVAGIIADNYNRKTLSLASTIVWSVATLATALSHTYVQVVLARILMGCACAFTTPTGYTLIRDRVPPEQNSLANSIYGTGVAVASALASLSILLDTNYGWRNTLLLIGAFGMLVALINALVLAEDDSKATEARSLLDLTSSPLDGFAEVLAVPRVQWIFLASLLRFCSGLCIGVWGAPYFRMTFTDHQSEYAVAQAVISAVGASISGIVGGATADALAKDTSRDGNSDPVGRKLMVPVAGSLLAVPAWYFAVHSSESFETAMAWLAMEYLFAECWFGPTISSLQSSVESKVGGTAQGMFTLTGAIANLAPSFLGYIYSYSQSVDGSTWGADLAFLLSASVCTCYLASAACFSVAASIEPRNTNASTESNRS